MVIIHLLQPDEVSEIRNNVKKYRHAENIHFRMPDIEQIRRI